MLRLPICGLVLLTIATATAQDNRHTFVCTDTENKPVSCPANRTPAPPPLMKHTPPSCTDLDGKPLPCPSVANEMGAVSIASSNSDNGNVNPFSASFLRHLAGDQVAIWSSPRSLQQQDVTWLLPLSATIATVMASDRGIQSHMPHTASTVQRFQSLSNYGAFALAGATGGACLWGAATHNDHLRETGVLAGEAALNSVAIAEALKTIAGRQRPDEGDGRGTFRQGGSSFPSMHAIFGWSTATVIAHEYPGPLTKLLAYGTAAAISGSRVAGQKHFASDVLVGSALGWYAGNSVFHRRAGADDSRYGTFQQEHQPLQPRAVGSSYVPLDSWVYPAIDRLAALGYIDSAFLGLRPWTRMECSRLLSEAEALLRDDGQNDGEEYRLVRTLRTEFSSESYFEKYSENTAAEVEAVYTRLDAISGTPLLDGYHFGQTLTNDFGRPSGSGLNAIVGVSAHSSAGPLALYFSGEYQHAASTPSPSLATEDAITTFEHGVPSAISYSGVDRLRTIESYVAVNLSGWQVSFGKQSLWWGPGQGSAFMFSDNAEPLWMLRLNRTTPIRMPGLLDWLGANRSEYFLARMQGYHFVRLAWPTFPLFGSANDYLSDQPFLYGFKTSFKPTPNLEFGVSLTSVIGGPGRPLTWGTFFHSFNSRGNAQPLDPGDRRTGFDFRYKIPRLRKWLVLYNDSFAEDEPNPIAYPRRSAMNPGIYVPQIPRLPKLDFRAEGIYTNLPGLRDTAFFYSNTRYAEGFTSYGQLLGSWIGRQGSGYQLWSTYWVSARKKIQAGYRDQTSDPSFLGGGRLHDFSVKVDTTFRRQLAMTGTLQVERWNFPLLKPSPETDVSLSLQFSLNHAVRLMKKGSLPSQ